ncbi:MAG TPA: endonuclease III [Spirochaetota bacterium]|nr:endonuclease III [Spirochaetota bacterium]
MDIFDFEYVTKILEESYYTNPSPSVTLIANTKKDPFNILLSTILSLRTKDKVTLEASNRLFEKVKNFNDILDISINEIERLIYPVGFYKTKAKRIKEIAKIIVEKYDGKVPKNFEELLKLPGVGRKTANLVIILGYNKDSICVDTHVHRIANRFGWVKTKKPEETEFALKKLLPVYLWKKINDYLVSYGQTVCKPVKPLCNKCKLNNICPSYRDK